MRLWQPQVVELWQENDSAQVFSAGGGAAIVTARLIRRRQRAAGDPTSGTPLRRRRDGRCAPVSADTCCPRVASGNVGLGILPDGDLAPPPARAHDCGIV